MSFHLGVQDSCGKAELPIFRTAFAALSGGTTICTFGSNYKEQWYETNPRCKSNHDLVLNVNITLISPLIFLQLKC